MVVVPPEALEVAAAGGGITGADDSESAIEIFMCCNHSTYHPMFSLAMAQPDD